MPGWTMINGVWREMWNPASKTDDVIRDDNIYGNINDVVRVIHERNLTADSIAGFKLVYHRSGSLQYPDMPYLVNNPKIPIRADPTGDNPNEMSTSDKGIVFQYFVDDVEEEGIAAYEGYLFAVLHNGECIDVCRSTADVAADERIDTGIPGYDGVWLSNRIAALDIQIEAQIWYESFGLYTFGWNDFFTTERFLNKHNYPNKGPVTDWKRIDKYSITPIDYRASGFYTVAKIGIARDMHSEFNHMIGSKGTISQSLNQVTVDGIVKPYAVEIYN